MMNYIVFRPLYTLAFLLAVSVILAACDSSGYSTSGVFNLEGVQVDPLANNAEVPVVLLFVSAQCPISNRYAPEVQRLVREFFEDGVRFWLVYTDPRESAAKIRVHLDEYGYDIPAVLDTEHALVSFVGARVTPEAAVFTDQRLRYLGRIDDWYTDFGVARAKPASRDLHRAIATLVSGGQPAPASSRAIGCYIAPLER